MVVWEPLHWAKRLSKLKLHAYQLSHRGGEIKCALKGDRVEIFGKAVMYAQGVIQPNYIACYIH